MSETPMVEEPWRGGGSGGGGAIAWRAAAGGTARGVCRARGDEVQVCRSAAAWRGRRRGRRAAVRRRGGGRVSGWSSSEVPQRAPSCAFHIFQSQHPLSRPWRAWPRPSLESLSHSPASSPKLLLGAPRPSWNACAAPAARLAVSPLRRCRPNAPPAAHPGRPPLWSSLRKNRPQSWI